MPKFRELGAPKCRDSLNTTTPDQNSLIAKRYSIQQRLGRGSFGTVYLVRDTKAAFGEHLKVLKEIPVGGLNPNETVQATQEAQLLSQLHHPAILKFYTSFLERDAFCIITEYCEDRDLDCKLEELRVAGQSLSEKQVTEWLIQLLLGVHYMHQRRILHRDLKAKNIFLKRNIVKIGDFGVSCLLMGSCDLATTFTGTPYYMSPEALSHRGYDSKSDIWSLGCILYEMCCLEHAFEGHNFLSVVMKIVEGSSPCLPDTYSRELNSIMQSMLEKDPLSRISAADALRTKFIEENMQSIKHKFSGLTLRDRCSGGNTAQILRAVRKVHLQTLRERSEVQKMTPRERMRLRKLQAADEEARKLKLVAEEKYQENRLRVQEFRSRNFQKVSVDVLNEREENTACQIQQVTAQRNTPTEHPGPMGDQLCTSESLGHDIPEDPQSAEAYYYEERFESCSEEEEEEEEGEEAPEEPVPSDTFHQTFGQDSDLEAMIKHMKNVLEGDSSGAASVAPERSEPLTAAQGTRGINCTMVKSRIQRMRESVCQRLGGETFQKVYDYLKQARDRSESEGHIREALSRLVDRPSDCFEVDQLLYYEELLQDSQNTTCFDKAQAGAGLTEQSGS
ncbi:serine/threonine-protein kinase Nek11 [Chanos chanos]|uniref:Serine/threonine-protein kinase Nek11 n=1 Tax=Chanos chanos TaxID=29144 RepID=A0A6J2W6K2_CHACN|nr:serine/threonine-protein kinase Nek11 [Chanos chanos]